MVLVDTSIWIEIFRKPSRLRIDEVADFDEIVTALPIMQEVLQGFGDEAASRTARESMLALPMAETSLEGPVFLEAVDLYRAARRAGFTVRSSTDCLIAACALRHHLEVAHIDRDYEQIAKVSQLRTRRIRLKFAR